MESQRRTLVHWFRKGLRVHDNPALERVFSTARASPEKFYVRPIFILDPGILDWMQIGANRWRFLQQTLADLDKQLRQLKSRLYVVRGKPIEVFPQLFKRWQVELLTFESDIETYAQQRDASVQKLARTADVKVDIHCSHTIYNPEVVIAKNLGKAPITYQKFLSIVDQLKIPAVLERPKVLTMNMKPPADELELEDANVYDCPTLEELVKRPEELGVNKFAGETEALRRMADSLGDELWVANFEKPKTAPNSLEPSTTVLSPYLKFGCLSSRVLHKRLREILARQPKHSKPPVSLIGQLMWREFYYTVAAADPNFDRMLGNAYSLQIPWQEKPEHLEAWTHGRTGYPFIDAIMRQLRQEGWIHHLARHAVACFLTRGDLWISWEEGQRVFEQLLLDQDWALNAGNWMWLSASAFFHQYFRVYSPVAFGKKTDPSGDYIRKYVPELAKYPSGCIYEPWKATLSAQREYGCVLGEDYPHRIVNHDVVHKENIKRMSAAYKVNRQVRTGKMEDEEDEQEQISTGKRKARAVGTSAKSKRIKNVA
ncbi:cryptochrome-2 isoform X2 [Scaptodrosophila lebanonensis]|uniref:Cryptochrome-2 isoform X2 n=1 Tax=Drosophila lebanonensis TaxID=7225 RepID=A0A6J2U0I8_DROLE|nr:cryptochrome-2 isoform X2 [Scaptodrosophila lebanonensis]